MHMCNLDCVKLVTVLQHSKVEFSNNVQYSTPHGYERVFRKHGMISRLLPIPRSP